MRQSAGYALLRDPRNLYSRPRPRLDNEYLEYLQSLRSALPFIRPTRYRGISREPLRPVITLEMGDTEVLTSALIPESLHAQIIAELEKQRTARAMHRQFIGEDTPEDDYDEVLLPSLADAQAIFAVLEAPHDYEIVRLSREPFTDQNTLLGYDVGYWGGDHFSLICDTVIQPLAHPPDPGEFAALGEHLRCLNEVMLFQSAADARTFRDFYLSTSWGETENPWAQFSIIQLSLPNLCNGPW